MLNNFSVFVLKFACNTCVMLSVYNYVLYANVFDRFKTNWASVHNLELTTAHRPVQLADI